MNENIKNLKGSEKRDIFKWAHKYMMSNASFYASDADLCLISNNPRGIIAYLDYKGNGEEITYTEKILYDEWVEMKPVFIVAGNDPENGPFEIKKYSSGGETILVCKLNNWNEFLTWEAKLRQDYYQNAKLLRNI